MQFHVLLLATLCAAQVLYYARGLDSAQKVPVGTLSFAEGTLEAQFASADPALQPGLYCIGTDDLPGKSCFAYLEVSGRLGGKFVAFVGPDGELVDVTFVQGPGELSGTAEVRNRAAQPQYDETFRQKEPVKTQKVTRRKVVENEAGEKVEVEETVEEVVEVDNRSWIQKNWLYVVLPLVLFLVLAPDDKK